MSLRLVSWNINCQGACWSVLKQQGADVALLQEAQRPPPGVALDTLPRADGDWTTPGGRRNFCASIATLNPDVSSRALPAKPIDRMEAIGLPLVGPRAPNGRQAVPKPRELPDGSLDVPTYFNRGGSPSTATRQLDFVFASPDLHSCTRVCEMNWIEEWGPSDHCRIVIEVAG